MPDTSHRPVILLISPYWKEKHRWMVSSFKMAELWQRLGYRVVVACMGSETKTEKVSDTLTVHFRKDFFLPDPWNYGIAFGFSGFVRRLIKQEKPDQIIVNKLLFWTSLATIPLTLSGKKVLVITDALVGMTWWPRGKIPQIAAAIYAWTAGWLILCMAHKVVFFHPQPEKLLKRLRIARKARVIPTGIDPTSYGRVTGHEPLADFAPDTRDQRPNIVVTYIGRLESVKGVDDYVEAAVPLKEEFPEIDIQVVGWYPSTSSGQATHPLVLKHDRTVRFTGLRDDIPEILSRTNIFVLPSYSEGLSNALMEAMSSGCACIASDVGGNSFLIQNGVSGFLFPAGDREALQSHIRRLLKDPAKAKAMGEAARKRIDEMFSWEVVGKKYADLFHELKLTHD